MLYTPSLQKRKISEENAASNFTRTEILHFYQDNFFPYTGSSSESGDLAMAFFSVFSLSGEGE